ARRRGRPVIPSAGGLVVRRAGRTRGVGRRPGRHRPGRSPAGRRRPAGDHTTLTTTAKPSFGGPTQARVAQLLGDDLPTRRPSTARILLSPLGLVLAVSLTMCIGQTLATAVCPWSWASSPLQTYVGVADGPAGAFGSMELESDGMRLRRML